MLYHHSFRKNAYSPDWTNNFLAADVLRIYSEYISIKC